MELKPNLPTLYVQVSSIEPCIICCAPAPGEFWDRQQLGRTPDGPFFWQSGHSRTVHSVGLHLGRQPQPWNATPCPNRTQSNPTSASARAIAPNLCIRPRPSLTHSVCMAVGEGAGVRVTGTGSATVSGQRGRDLQVRLERARTLSALRSAIPGLADAAHGPFVMWLTLERRGTGQAGLCILRHYAPTERCNGV